MQGSVYQVRTEGPGAVVYRRVLYRAFPSDHHGCRVAMFQPCHVPIWQGYDAQGVSTQYGQYGYYHGELFTVCFSFFFFDQLLIHWNFLLDNWQSSTEMTLPKTFSLALALISTYRHQH